MEKEGPTRSIQEIDYTPRGKVHPSPADWRDHFIYFLLVDRFDDNEDHPPYDGTHNDAVRDYRMGVVAQGGKLAGVTRRLPYIKKLGATALWISPVFKNRTDASGMYHGYAVQNFLDIDPRLGTKEDLRELVRRAHELGMYVILDIVINHTGDNWAYEGDQHPGYRGDGARYPFGYWRGDHSEGFFTEDDAVWPAELQSPECYERRGAIGNWGNEDEMVHGDFFNLKALNYQNDIVLETMTAVHKYWIAEADIDGYRIDAARHVEIDKAVKFFNGIKEFAASIGKKNFFLFGEIATGDDIITKFVGRQGASGERLQALDAALDFPLYFVLEEVMKGFASPELLRERGERIHRLYPNIDATDCLVTFLDNHDQVARPYRRFLHGDPYPQQALLAMAYLLTGIGIPTIYYGTEQGFDGGDPNNNYYLRENMFGGKWGAFGTSGMQFFNEDHPLYVGIALIARLRGAEPALRYGRFYFREVSEYGNEYQLPVLGRGMIAYSRILDSTEILVALNLKGEQYMNHIAVDKTLTPPGTLLADLINGKEYLVEERAGRASVAITLPPFGVAILKQKVQEKSSA